MELLILKRGLVIATSIACLFSLSVFSSLASETPSQSKTKNSKDKFQLEGTNQPITITSDHLEGDNKNNKALFSGNVVARRGDITISCEKISIIYDEDVKTAKEIIAEGQVRITQGERIATGERAVFNNSEEKITLTGRPQLREGDNTIEGGKITLFLAEDRGIVEADTEIRVNATIQMEKNTREKKD